MTDERDRPAVESTLHVPPAAPAVKWRWPILLAWAGLFAVLLPAASRLRSSMEAATYLRASESAAVEQSLRTDFGSRFAQILLLVATDIDTDPQSTGPGSLAVLSDSLRSIRGVTGTLSFLDGGDTLLLGRTPGSAIVVVGVDPAGEIADSLVTRLREATDSPSLLWTGPQALSLDLRHASAAHAHTAELRALPLTVFFLVVAFGSFVAALLPVLFGVGTIVTALGAALLVTIWWTPSIMLESVVSILGLALGIDYALLFVTRFREALADDMDSREAAGFAASRAGHTIFLSGSSVAVGFAALLAVPIDEIRSVALGGLLTVTAAVLLATTLLPALLSWLGGRVNLGRPWTALRKRGDEAGSRPGSPGEGWVRWGRFVTAHPVPVLVVAGLPLVLLTIPAFRMSTMTPQQDWLPPSMESARALHSLDAMGRGQLPNTMTVLLDLPPGSSVTGVDGWNATARLTGALAGDDRVSRVRSLPALANELGYPSQLLLSFLPDSVRREFVSADGSTARLNLVPREGTDMAELAELVRHVRGMDLDEVTGVSGGKLRVGGIPAYQVDYEEGVARAFPLVIVLVICGIFVALALGFRSLLIPLKATILNLLSVGAAFGALVLVFQDGHGSWLLGLEQPLEGVFPAVPILVFCIVFGLSMDYEVFLVGRVAEARREARNGTEADAIVQGLAGTGRLITSAAGIMIIIFAAFSTGEYLPAKLLGFALTVAVLADATLVRLAIGPALLQLAGRWNWWPGDRQVDRLEGIEP